MTGYDDPGTGTDGIGSEGVAVGRGADPVGPLADDDPRQLGPYLVEGRIGDGGMGSVYLGRSPGGRRVAIKVVRAVLASEPEFRARFLREAEAARRVARFCTAEVLEVDTTGDRPYLVTEYIEGPTLSAAVRRDGPLPAADLERLAVAVASALTAIHAAGLVHRDLKPGNIIMSSSGARVIDFGIARAAEHTSNLTQTGAAIGTPAYMSPEQALGQPVTAAADIYAWGGVVLHAGTGRTPFGDGPSPVILYRAVNERPDFAGLDGGLRPLVERAMAKDPAARPSAQQLFLALAGGTVPAEPREAGVAFDATELVAGHAPRSARSGPPTRQEPAYPPRHHPTPPQPPPAQSQSPPAQSAPPYPAAPRYLTAPRYQAPPQPAPPPPPGQNPYAPAPGHPPYPGRYPRRSPYPYGRGRRGRRGRRRPATRVATAVMTLVFGGFFCLVAYEVYVRATNPVSEQALREPLSEHSGPVNAVAFSLDGTTLATASSDDTVRLWNVQYPSSARPTGRPLVGHTAAVTTLAFSPDSAMLATGSEDRTVQLWNVADPTNPTPVGSPLRGHFDAVTSLAFTGDGRLVSGSRDSSVHLWDLADPANPQDVWHVNTLYPVRDVSVSSLGVLAAGSDIDQVTLWNLADLSTPHLVTTGHGVGVRSLAFSADGTRLVIGSGAPTTQIWDVAALDQPFPLTSTLATCDGLHELAFSPDGRTLAVACGDNDAELWDVTSPNAYLVDELTGHRDGVTSVAFTLDSSTAATGSLDGTARLWNVRR